MNLNKILRITGYLGATICGVCMMKTCIKSYGFIKHVSADSRKAEAGTSKSSRLKDLTLKQVHIYFRHGARTPIHIIPELEEVSYPQDFMLRTPPHMLFNYQVRLLPELTSLAAPSEIEEFYKQTPVKGGGYLGNLTTYGHEQMYCLGHRLRQIYLDGYNFLPDGYNPQDVFIQSTNIQRTILSACCVLAGLFGNKQLDKKGPVIIPVSRTNDEVLFPNPFACQLLKDALTEANAHFDNIPGVREDRILVEKALGCKPDRQMNLMHLHDDLTARMAQGYLIPEDLRPLMKAIRLNATKILFYAECGWHSDAHPTMTKLSIGTSLNVMMKEIDRLLSGERTQKMYLYSTHDSTILAMLEAFGIFEWEWPPFAADLRVEVYQDKAGEYWARLIYVGNERIVRGCSGPLCHLAEFQSSMKPYIIARGPEFDSLCSSGNLQQLTEPSLGFGKDIAEHAATQEKPGKPPGM